MSQDEKTIDERISRLLLPLEYSLMDKDDQIKDLQKKVEDLEWKLNSLCSRVNSLEFGFVAEP